MVARSLQPVIRLVLLMFAACGIACGPRVPSLASTHASPEALASAVASAIEHSDAETLRRLVLSEQEFRDHVWPELPSARPERNLPFSYVWRDLRVKSEAGLARTLAEYGGRRLTVAGVRFAEGVTQYATYVVHRDARVTVVSGDGERDEMRLFGSVLEKDGTFKVFSYVID